ncbi:MAG: amidohydrolase [Xanthobacteraceae bacterium]|nr:amidohydrolase [Xanthobacteraceae bacterium]
MIIDWHTHVHSEREQAMPRWKGQCPATIDNVLRLHDEVGLDVSVISNSGHYLKDFSREDAVPAIRASNEYLASLRDKHKDRIVALAVAIPGGGDDHLKELERAVREDDLRGVIISSSHRRAYPDDDDAKPFFKLCCDLDIPVFMHPPSVGFGEERMKEFRLASSVGRPFDSCLALARLIVKGLFEEFPTIKFVASHLGGGICEIIGRMDYAYELRDNPVILGPYGPPVHITRKPSDYLRMMYFDTVAYHAPAIECAIKTVGADRLIFGTDSPMLIALKQRGRAIIDELGLDAADKARVLGGTARTLLKL